MADEPSQAPVAADRTTLVGPSAPVDVATLGDHLLVHHPTDRQLHALNPTAAAVWQAAVADEAPRPVAEVVEVVAATFGVRPEAIEADVLASLADLGTSGLVTFGGSSHDVAGAGATSGASTPGAQNGPAAPIEATAPAAPIASGAREAPTGPDAPVALDTAAGPVSGSRRWRAVPLDACWLDLRQELLVDPPLADVVADLIEPLRGAPSRAASAERWTLERESSVGADEAEAGATSADGSAGVRPGTRWILRREGSIEARTTDADQAIRALLTRSNAAAIESCVDDVVLHAGAVAGPGGAVLVVGDPDAGKSTLVAVLARRGATYLTDEAARVRRRAAQHRGGDGSGFEVLPYPKPLSLAPASLALQADVLGASATGVELVGGHLAPAALEAPIGRRPTPVVAVVLPDRARPAQALEPVAAVEAVLRLAGQVFNLPARGGDGLELLASLVTEVPIYEVGTEGLHGALGLLDALLGLER